MGCAPITKGRATVIAVLCYRLGERSCTDRPTATTALKSRATPDTRISEQRSVVGGTCAIAFAACILLLEFEGERLCRFDAPKIAFGSSRS